MDRATPMFDSSTLGAVEAVPGTLFKKGSIGGVYGGIELKSPPREPRSVVSIFAGSEIASVSTGSGFSSGSGFGFGFLTGLTGGTVVGTSLTESGPVVPVFIEAASDGAGRSGSGSGSGGEGDDGTDGELGLSEYCFRNFVR